MSWWSVLCVVLFATAFVSTVEEPKNSHASVTAVTEGLPTQASILGPVEAALAIQDVIKLVLEKVGVAAIFEPAAEACRVPDNEDCLHETLWALADPDRSFAPIVAIVAVPGNGTPQAWRLEDFGLQELGEIMPPSRRACLASKSTARSLLDLTDRFIAASFNLPHEEIQPLMEPCNKTNCHYDWVPEWCLNETCATILTSRKGEADVLLSEIKEHKLYAYVVPLEEKLSRVSSMFADHSIIACDWAPETYYLSNFVNQAKILGPPPCIKSSCPFETRRIVKYTNIRQMVQAPSAHHALVKLYISKEDMRKLATEASNKGPAEAARTYVHDHPPQPYKSEVSVAVLLPHTTDREAYNIVALTAAAMVAEEDVKEMKTINFKVQTKDDKCHAQGAYKLLFDAPGSGEFGALSAIAGPACGAAWADTAKQSAIHHLPLLAYTPQAPASQSKGIIDSPLQLLAAGDARDGASALAELVSRLGWSRIAALTEPATKPLLHAFDKELLFDIEVPENGSNIGYKYIRDWASKAASKNARILYLCVEDARIARAAMCAAHSYGLTPSSGAVWLLCNTHKPGWLEAKRGEACTTEQLQEEAEGHFSVSPGWALAWQKKQANISAERKEWEKRWRKKCHLVQSIVTNRQPIDECAEVPDPNAALLYDILRHWADGLTRLLHNNTFAADDLHNLNRVRSLINDTVTSEYNGLTGTFKWATVTDAYSRVVSFVLSQWDSKSGAKVIGTWNNGSLELNNVAIKWYTSDGVMPDDGGEKCALEGLANALNTDCRIAFVALCSFLVAILVIVVTAIAWHCKRRAEKEYRKRLHALGMRPLAIKPVALDRWEVPRERVVINRKLGTGAFGTVYGGHALLAEDKGWSAVAVKTLKAGATTEEKLDFLSEAEAMKRFDHKNVVRLLGVVTKTEPVCTVMEFMLYGDLKNYLLARRHLAMGGGIEDSEGLEADEASPKRLTGMALDVARALSYLAQLRYVHRDVAARNCLVSARRVVKLADFGMTRLVFENDYYRFSRKGMLPVRWMAPESLALGVFSPASDVWSFGVLLYEIVTFSSLPFQGLSNSEVLTRVKGGHTLDLPHGLKPQLEGLIKSCWQQDPKKRPTASEVAAFLADAPRLLSPCLDVPLDALPLDADPPWRLPRDQAEARWVSWAAPASAATDTTYLSTEGTVPLDTDSFLP